MWNKVSLKVLNKTHHFLVRLTGGRIGWCAGRMPVVEMITVGRKTGRRRSTMLTSPVQEGERWVLVAGADHDPGWLHNLRARPEVEVSRKHRPNEPMRARIATPDERARLWPQATAKYKGYAAHQRGTDREIPLVMLEPID